MKQFTAMVMTAFVLWATSGPAFADSAAKGETSSEPGETTLKNVTTGSRNVGIGWVEVMDSQHAEAAKGKNAGEQLTGLVAGSAIGVRKTLHRAGAGVIDLVTFWIPKKQPLISPEKARLE